MVFFTDISETYFTNRRIAYQETSQTFGVLSTRTEVEDASGGSGTQPVRPSASTTALSTSVSPNKNALRSSNDSDGAFGEEIEIHSLLVVDQHTFESELFEQSVIV